MCDLWSEGSVQKLSRLEILFEIFRWVFSFEFEKDKCVRNPSTNPTHSTSVYGNTFINLIWQIIPLSKSSYQFFNLQNSSQIMIFLEWNILKIDSRVDLNINEVCDIFGIRYWDLIDFIWWYFWWNGWSVKLGIQKWNLREMIHQ